MEGEAFFFGKKKQKTFDSAVADWWKFACSLLRGLVVARGSKGASQFVSPRNFNSLIRLLTRKLRCRIVRMIVHDQNLALMQWGE